MMNLKHLSIHSVEALEVLGKKGVLEVTSEPVLPRIFVKNFCSLPHKRSSLVQNERGDQCQQILFKLVVMVCI